MKYIPLLILKGKQGGSRRQERDAGKNKRGVCPCAVLDNWSFYGLSKDQRRRIFAGWSLHGFFTVFTKTASRCKSAPEAGWSSRRPSGFRHSQRPPSFSCPCMGFLRALRRPFSDVRESCKLCGLYNDRFQAHTKTTCRKEKKLLPGQSLKTDRVTAP